MRAIDRKRKANPRNRGWMFFRSESHANPWERIFAEEWAKACKPNRAINFGYGALQDLFLIGWPYSLEGYRCIARITPREEMIVATVIQWFGTNCGRCWLEETLSKGRRLYINRSHISESVSSSTEIRPSICTVAETLTRWKV